MYVCPHTSTGHAHAKASVSRSENNLQRLVLSFLPEGSQESDSGYQTWQQGPLPTVPSRRPSIFFYVHWEQGFHGEQNNLCDMLNIGLILGTKQ